MLIPAGILYASLLSARTFAHSCTKGDLGEVGDCIYRASNTSGGVDSCVVREIRDISDLPVCGVPESLAEGSR